ncbi:hypothetical protein B0H67DRAFT_683132, partial [Lasiosphaeris hirsuta]
MRICPKSGIYPYPDSLPERQLLTTSCRRRRRRELLKESPMTSDSAGSCQQSFARQARQSRQAKQSRQVRHSVTRPAVQQVECVENRVIGNSSVTYQFRPQALGLPPRVPWASTNSRPGRVAGVTLPTPAIQQVSNTDVTVINDPRTGEVGYLFAPYGTNIALGQQWVSPGLGPGLAMGVAGVEEVRAQLDRLAAQEGANSGDRIQFFMRRLPGRQADS